MIALPSVEAVLSLERVYTALLAARAQEAIRRRRRFLYIDASPMSRPIVAKHGFFALATTVECQWKPQ